jgi:RNA polymerase sigma-70 factor, ECF subfamily
MIDRGRRRWPAIDVAAASFARFVAQRVTVAEDETVEYALTSLFAEDLWLACACLDGDQSAHRELEAMLHSVADASGAARDLSIEGSKDLRQSLLESLLVGRHESGPKLANYSGKGNLRSWLWTIVFRESLRLKAHRFREEEFEEGIENGLNLGDSDPEIRQIKAECRAAFRRAFRIAVKRLDEDARILLRNWVYDGLTFEEVAKMMGQGRSTVVRRVREIRSSLLKNTLLEMGRDLSLKRSEVESMMRELNSRLEASLSDAVGGRDVLGSDPG